MASNSSECDNPTLARFFDALVNPRAKRKGTEPMEPQAVVEQCMRMIAGQRTPKEFADIVKAYDNTVKCSFVWEPKGVAYRCYTCSKTECMSLCLNCFKDGNHENHNFNMFCSESGGACDCGDTDVMEECGFCSSHGPKNRPVTANAPEDLTQTAEVLMPRILYRLILQLRETQRNHNSIKEYVETDISIEANLFLELINKLVEMGGLMRRVINAALTSPEEYQTFMSPKENIDAEYAKYLQETQCSYDKAILKFTNKEPKDEYKHIRFVQSKLEHKTFLEELLFWTVAYGFPEQIRKLLIKMLPDADYKRELTRAFVLHYSRLPKILRNINAKTSDLIQTLVQISVQLFSKKDLVALIEADLLPMMIPNLVDLIVPRCLIPYPYPIIGDNETPYQIIDCSHQIMTSLCFTPLVSDLTKILSYKTVAAKFMSDDSLLRTWFEFMKHFQGMNVSVRMTEGHIGYESRIHETAFMSEFDICAFPMWALASHLTDEGTVELSKKLLKVCYEVLSAWFENSNFKSHWVSFHLPLHRYFSVFLGQAVKNQGVALDEIMPRNEEQILQIMEQPLKLQVAVYEITNGLWERNGLEMRTQAATYVLADFYRSTIDADLHLLQICSTRVDPNKFFERVLEVFCISQWMNLAPCCTPRDKSEPSVMVECYLLFLSTLISIRNNLGLSREEVNLQQLVGLLCVSDCTYSQIKDQLSEMCPSNNYSADIKAMLQNVANKFESGFDAGGKLIQGKFSPKPHVWEKLYDPIHVLYHTYPCNKGQFQDSMDRYVAKVRHKAANPWPPFRTPKKCLDAYKDPRSALQSRLFQATAFVILHKALKEEVTENVLALVVFLLDQTAMISEPRANHEESTRILTNGSLDEFFISDSLLQNATTTIDACYESNSSCDCIPPTPSTSTQHQPSSISDLLGPPTVTPSSEPLNLVQLLRPSFQPSIQSPPSFRLAEFGVVQERWTLVKGRRPNGSVAIKESIISLLLKLYKRFSRERFCLDGDKEMHEDEDEVLIGDGSFYIGRLLRRLARLDRGCLNVIEKVRTQLWPGHHVSDFDTAREERRRRAKERQRAVIADFASKQKRFLESASVAAVEEMEVDQETASNDVFDCVFCNQSTPTTETRPMGLVIFAQNTTINGQKHYRKLKERILPTSLEESSATENVHSGGKSWHWTEKLKMCEAVEKTDPRFNAQSWLVWKEREIFSGLHVQTCGHHLHFDCLESYLEHFDRGGTHCYTPGEYLCPLCRQMANGAIPLLPRKDAAAHPDFGEVAKPMAEVLCEIEELLHAPPQEEKPLTQLTSQIIVEARRLFGLYQIPLQKINLAKGLGEFLPLKFITSTVKANLEIDVVQRGNSLVRADGDGFNGRNLRRNCIRPLVQAISEFTKNFLLSDTHVRDTFQIRSDQISRTFHVLVNVQDDANNLISDFHDIILLRDPASLLIQFFLTLPLQRHHFNVLLHILYRLLRCQISMQLYNRYICDTSAEEAFQSSASYNSSGNSSALTNISELCMPFLRIIAVLKHYIYEENLPQISQREHEFHRLVEYLGLDRDIGPISVTPWLEQFKLLQGNKRKTAKELLVEQHTEWCAPKLLKLPQEYDKIFSFYRENTCEKCRRVPSHYICLVCGKALLRKGSCCKLNVGTVSQHATECGAKTGIFLDVKSTSVVLIRDRKTCVWGSLYLDEFDCEDKDLKRGRPLFLNQDRYELLQREWLTLHFDDIDLPWKELVNPL